ncbi:acetyl-CoA hydrolase/transferase C-terminal domain-containing protein [Marinicella meishanensis]|uniref:acetyl-CoA hydrolase/transferase C-terminal domain-containing protein n=1 Tax=Marinicella meishanensis TaxID=2873263 RepID=UPI001CBB11D6|nr:acetyl-CoA hydrolase/transferase C-terminal domain-containing protein [Marinicella sp. NBU2979]
MPINTPNTEELIAWLVKQVGHDWVVGTPLGIGKPNPLVNAVYQHAKTHAETNLELFTALSLAIPKGNSILERRFLQAFTQRFFGDYPELSYIDDVQRDQMPPNIRVREFYMQSGKMLRSKSAQQAYVSSNYTHVARDMVDRHVNIILQMVAVERTDSGLRYSLSCNPDLTLDIIRIAQEKGKPRPLVVAMVNQHLPFMGGQAAVNEDFFDAIFDDPDAYFEPFATPAQAISATDYSIGLLASTLLKDGGTLQIGIGSLADALVYSTVLRQKNNPTYHELLQSSGMLDKFGTMIKQVGDTRPFTKGLYAASEMFVEGFAHLFDARILKRKVYPDAEIQQLVNDEVIEETFEPGILGTLLQHHVIDEVMSLRQFKRLQYLGVLQADLTFDRGVITAADGQSFSADLHDADNLAALEQHAVGRQLQHGAVLHAAFFMGSKRFYHWLHGLRAEIRPWFQMTPVSQINELYGGEALDRVQRIKARFINTCMKVDVLGAAASDSLEDHQVVSGVGGQYNFVAMAHALADSRSVLMLRSVHISPNSIESNVVWKYGYCTIPRHLRDIVITEYGMADLRGQSDETCIQRMICIADSRFQESLRAQAVAHNKLSANWQVPEPFRHNTPEKIKQQLTEVKQQGYFPPLPFGEDFTAKETVIIESLQWLRGQTKNKYGTLLTLIKAMWARPMASHQPYLELMNLTAPQQFKEKLAVKLLVFALRHHGH